MVTIYLNPINETFTAAFIDRMYNDELGLSISSAQSFENLYQVMYEQASSFPDSELYTDDISSSLIQSAMQGVHSPN